MYLLDTNVVSELRKAATGRADEHVVTWAKAQLPQSLFISTVTVLEIKLGILRVARRDDAQGQLLSQWLETQVLPAFEGRILAIDSAVALRCADLHVPDPRPERDALIAATALVHSLTLVTRNVKDFEGTGATVLNAWRV